MKNISRMKNKHANDHGAFDCVQLEESKRFPAVTYITDPSWSGSVLLLMLKQAVFDGFEGWRMRPCYSPSIAR